MDGNSTPILRRSFLTVAGAALALPAILRVCKAEPSPGAPKLTTVLRADLQGQDQTVEETLVNLLDLPPAASAPWHMHPGAQEIVYVLEGAVVVEVGSEEPKELGPGGITLIAAEIPHLVRNKSTTATARAFNVYSRADKQKPFLVALKRGA